MVMAAAEQATEMGMTSACQRRGGAPATGQRRREIETRVV